MSRFRIHAPLVALVAALAVAPSLAGAAEPTLEVQPNRSRCVVPFEVIASGLEPGKPVDVFFTVDGVVTGSVVGESAPNGGFFAPIPLILLPCANGGEVTARMTVGGVLSPVTATFEIAGPVLPTTVTPTPTQGTPEPPEAGTGPGSSAATAARDGSLAVFIFIVALAAPGMVATWATRPHA